jgi:hypothetical protein
MPLTQVPLDDVGARWLGSKRGTQEGRCSEAPEPGRQKKEVGGGEARRMIRLLWISLADYMQEISCSQCIWRQ